MTAPLEALPLVRRITEHAYRAGASLVTTLFSDEEATLARFRMPPTTASTRRPAGSSTAWRTAFRNGAARLAIVGEDPSLLAGQDPAKVARANRARSAAYQPALELIAGFDINWTIVSYATPAWAKAVFPGESEDEAIARLWDAIFAASRIDAPDPVAAWAAHNAAPACARRAPQRAALRRPALPRPGHRPHGRPRRRPRLDGRPSSAKNGIVCNPNIPTEEVFTTPHKDRVDGHVTSHQAALLSGHADRRTSRVRFEAGRIVEAQAATGEEVLAKVLDTDEGARRLGEVALVPHSSPIATSGLLFFNTLFDENAASHIALGQAYSNASSMAAAEPRRSWRPAAPIAA